MRVTRPFRTPCLSFLVPLFAFIALNLAGCGKKEAKKKVKVDEALAGVISGFSGGTVSADGPVRVTLVNPGADSATVNKALDKSPFEFSPSIKGTAIWSDEKTLEFRPQGRLERGKTYQAVLRLDRILTVPEKLEKFEFEFSVMDQHFERDVGGLAPVDDKHPENQRLDGLLRLADGEDASVVERMLAATQNGKPLPVRWEHRPDRREHPFSVENIQRGADSSRLVLTWDGGPVGLDRKETDTVRVPSVNEFTVLDVEAGGGDSRHILVRFSDPPAKGADFRGLIEVPEQSGLRFQAEGNVVRIYSSNEWSGTKTVQVNAGLKSAYGRSLGNAGSFTVAFEEIKPGVRFVGKGVILPGEGKVTLPFEAVNLRSVDVRVVKIFAGNVPQFLQVNNLDGQSELNRVGRPVLKKTVALNPTASMRPRWARYALDLTELARKDAQPGTLYRVTLSFKKDHSTFPCADTTGEAGEEEQSLTMVEDEDADDNGGWDGARYYYDYDYEGYEGEYNWHDREDPCKPSYYRNVSKATRNFLASDVGLLAKSGRPGKLLVVATNLLTAGPLPDADLEIISYQHQVIAKAKTDGDGFAELEVKGKPFLLRASKGEQRGYLKLDEGGAIQMGNFDVGGQAVQEGLKGYLFGERGVWRPGDSLHLTFILEDRNGRLPKGHPVTLELRNPQGQLVRTLTKSSQGGFYGFATATDPDAPTGDYVARVKAGPAVFEERLKVETVVPNRLKINISFSPKPLRIGQPVRGSLDVRWLSGAVAKHLEADVEMTLQNAQAEFKGLEGWIFRDPARSFAPETQVLWEGRVDGSGKADFSKEVKVDGKAPGALRASFRTRVMEAGGGFSVDRWSEPFHPYQAYVGLKMPLKGVGYEALFIDSNHTVKLAAVDPDGNRLKKRRIEVKVFKAGWDWWWDREENDANYLHNEHRTRILWDTVVLSGDEAEWSFKISYPNYGRYVLRACDLDAKGGGGEPHCTGQSFYMDWPYWYGRADRDGQGGGAAILAFTTDKTKYKVGEKIKLTIPSPKRGRALISIEKGPAVFKRYWLDMKEKETLHEIEAEPGMAPNAYIHVTLLQPHDQTENDMPIRMYNVLPVMVEDPATILKPEVKVEPGVFRPGEKATLAVSEAQGRAMQYVVAVVDEGLLDLTRFPTPDPHGRFYAREALGIKTWDLYDFVAGAHGARLERLLSIGGDEDAPKAQEGRKGNRFPPMVRFLGPFDLGKGDKARHEISVPQYVGAVRVMIVAGKDGAYGHSDQSVFVRKPLMVLGTLPRVLSPGETFELPVSVFAMEKHVKEVDVEVIATGPVVLQGESRKRLTLDAPTDELVNFTLNTREAVGWSKVTIRAKSGNEKAEQVIEIEVRNPNSKVTDVKATLLQGGASWSQAFKLPGVAGTNKAVLELSRMPPLNLEKRLGYLVQYPHGCVEQTTSSAFPQLYLDALMDLDTKTKDDIQRNIRAAIQRLRNFQTPSGGFGYWPGSPDADNWSSSYAGHFLVEAEKKGYSVPAGILDQWKKYQRTTAQTWQGKYDHYQPLSQSYRLYTLALAGSAELGAMNRFKENAENAKLSPTARWQLGGAYYLAGQAEVAKSLVQGPATVKPYNELGGNFGSDLRDKAMMLEVLSIMGKKTEAAPLMQEVAEQLAREDWYSTQTTAYALLAAARYAGKIFDRSGEMPYAFKINGAAKEGRFSAPFQKEVLKIAELEENTIEVSNKGKALLYARVILEGVPPLGQETEAAQGIQLDIFYKDMENKDLDPSKLDQGTDFMAECRVRHTGTRSEYEQLALTTLFPSGWEIRNTRMDVVAAPEGKTESGFQYQDIRDDRVNTYFHLNHGEQKVFRFFLNAAYQGKFHLPQSKVEAMYDASIQSRTKSRPVTVQAETPKAGDPKAPSTLRKKKQADEDGQSGEGQGEEGGSGEGTEESGE